MAKDFSRTRRVAEQMRRELAELIQMELKDPRIGLVTLTDVEVASDYSHAKVFFTQMDSGVDVAESLRTLQRAAGFLRSQLAPRLTIRQVPQLHFVHDTSVARGIELSKLIDAAVAEDSKRGGSDA